MEQQRNRESVKGSKNLKEDKKMYLIFKSSLCVLMAHHRQVPLASLEPSRVG